MPLLSATGPVQEQNRDVNDPAEGALGPISPRPRGRSRLGCRVRYSPAAACRSRARTRQIFPQNRDHFCRDADAPT